MDAVGVLNAVSDELGVSTTRGNMPARARVWHTGSTGYGYWLFGWVDSIARKRGGEIHEGLGRGCHQSLTLRPLAPSQTDWHVFTAATAEVTVTTNGAEERDDETNSEVTRTRDVEVSSSATWA